MICKNNLIPYKSLFYELKISEGLSMPQLFEFSIIETEGKNINVLY